jgi:FG-GAP-like repeat
MRGRFGSFTLASAAALVVAVTANVPAATAQLSGPIVPVAVDMASAAGIAQTQISFDAVVQDFNGDALPDFLIGHHGTAAMQMFVNDGDGTFTEPNPNMFDRPDRHDCASADVNQDGRPDIACAIGADHGVGVKRNQLWIQNAGPPLGFTDSGVADGIADPFGRGRAPLLFDANNDGLPDLFMQSEPGRPDGYPSPNRFYVNGGGGVFHDAPAFGLDIDLPARTLGTGCVQAADVNSDGFQDVMLCAQDHLHIFLNQGGTHFVDASASLGVAGDSPNDATLQDVNGDGVPDLLEVTKGTFVVRPQQQGVFQPAAFSYPLTSGVAVAAGDANADGKPDVYLVQAGSVSGNVADVMLLNASSGSTVSFVSMTIPQVSTGIGQSAFPIDYDGNGLTDFLVLNGQNQPGPLELIAFFPTTGGPAARSANPSSPSSSAALPRVPGAP